MTPNIDKRLLDAHAISCESAVILSKNHDIRLCGCFYCESIFFTSEVDLAPYFEGGDHAAQCPYCGMDTVIPETSNFPLSANFLTAMEKAFFGEVEKRLPGLGYDPQPFLADAESLCRRDTSKIMSVIARVGCKVCVERKDCPVASGEPHPSDFHCCFEVNTARLTRAIFKGLEQSNPA